jgi:hypothetical protein
VRTNQLHGTIDDLSRGTRWQRGKCRNWHEINVRGVGAGPCVLQR